MDGLPLEILPSIFKRLSSLQMVLVMRVCREWLDIIDKDRSLWRELVLPDENFRENGLKVLELFDRKSGSTLTQVSMNIEALREHKAAKAAFIDILKKSKETLQILDLAEGRDGRYQSRLAEEVWDFPQLRFFRLDALHFTPVQLILSDRGRELTAHNHQGSPLRVLWVFNSKALFSSESPLLSNLVSLSVCKSHDSLRWRKVLEGPSQTLRHLEISLDDVQEHSISPLEFPNLRVLDLNLYGNPRNFPTWIRFPPSAALMIRATGLYPLPHLPSCSRLWITQLSGVAELQERCPELSELRLKLERRYLGSTTPADYAELVSMLRQRKLNVEAGMEIDGVRMVPLKTLVLLPSVRLIGQENLLQLRELVEEVIHLNSASTFIELEV